MKRTAFNKRRGFLHDFAAHEYAPFDLQKMQRLSNVTRAASAVSRTVWLSGYVLYDCLDECGKCLALILLESRNTII